jgi:SAM-dependent methyltransferase
VLHHLLSKDQQDRAFAEIHRVLRPGGVFLAVEIADGILHRLVHVRSTFTAVSPASIEGRMLEAGFSQVKLGFQRGAFRVRALRERTPPRP